jgi:hypothetical protein
MRGGKRRAPPVAGRPAGASFWGPQVSGARATGARGGPAETTDTGQALARLEAAVERLAIAAARPRAPVLPGEGVSRAQVQAIADRLDETIARLRSALGEDN